MIAPILIFGGIAALVLYEKLYGTKKAKGKHPAAPALPPGNPLPPGVSWKGLTYVPPTPAPAPMVSWKGLTYVPPGPPQVDTASQISGVTKSLLAEPAERGNIGLLPVHDIVQGILRNLLQTPTMQTLDDTIDKLRNPALQPEGKARGDALSELRGHLSAVHTVHVGADYPPQDLSPAQRGWDGAGTLDGGLLPRSGPAVDAGFVYEDTLVAGTPGALSPQLPRAVAHICAVILMQAMEKLPASSPPAAAPAPPPAVPTQAGAVSHGLARGRSYFVAWPSGGPPLRRDLWELATVTDSAQSPSRFAADPARNEPHSMKAVPASSPAVWLRAYGEGKAIAVLTWTGPQGQNDPAVQVIAEYAPRASQRAA